MAKKSMFEGFEVFAWSGVNKFGMAVDGLIPAESTMNAETILHQQGVSISTLKQKPKWLVAGELKDPKLPDIMLFTRQLSTMVSAGVPLAQAVEIIANGSEKINVRIMLTKIHRDIASGIRFADALAKFPKQFNQLVRNLIAAGESSGTLDIVLNQAADYMERIAILRGRIKKAMFYPIIMFAVTGAVAVLLLGFIVPQFAGMFASFGATLPFPTRVVIAISDFLQNYYWLMILVAIGAGVGFSMLKKRSEAFRIKLDLLKINLPLFGPLIQKAVLARVSRTLEVTLAAGIPLVEAMQNVAEIAGNRIYRQAILEIRDDIISGKQMNVVMATYKIFPPMLTQMVAVGEKSGEMERMLSKAADFYDEQVATMVDGLSTLIEPIMLIVLGLLIGGFVVSMYLPIFRLGTIM